MGVVAVVGPPVLAGLGWPVPGFAVVAGCFAVAGSSGTCVCKGGGVPRLAVICLLCLRDCRPCGRVCWLRVLVVRVGRGCALASAGLGGGARLMRVRRVHGGCRCLLLWLRRAAV